MDQMFVSPQNPYVETLIPPLIPYVMGIWRWVYGWYLEMKPLEGN